MKPSSLRSVNEPLELAECGCGLSVTPHRPRDPVASRRRVLPNLAFSEVGSSFEVSSRYSPKSFRVPCLLGRGDALVVDLRLKPFLAVWLRPAVDPHPVLPAFPDECLLEFSTLNLDGNVCRAAIRIRV